MSRKQEGKIVSEILAELPTSLNLVDNGLDIHLGDPGEVHAGFLVYRGDELLGRVSVPITETLKVYGVRGELKLELGKKG